MSNRIKMKCGCVAVVGENWEVRPLKNQTEIHKQVVEALDFCVSLVERGIPPRGREAAQGWVRIKKVLAAAKAGL